MNKEILEKELNKTYNLITNKGTKIQLTVKSIKSNLSGHATIEISKMKYNGKIEYDLSGRWQIWNKTGDRVITLNDDRLIVVRNEYLIDTITKFRYECMEKGGL